MIVFMLVAVIMYQGQATYTVSANQPFLRTLAECQEHARPMAKAPPIVAEITCERVKLDMATGRTTKAP